MTWGWRGGQEAVAQAQQEAADAAAEAQGARRQVVAAREEASDSLEAAETHRDHISRCALQTLPLTSHGASPSRTCYRR